MSSHKPENPPAFPNVATIARTSECSMMVNNLTEGGMTLRDYFAGQALLGMTSYAPVAHKDTAEDAYLYADAMLKERAKS